MLRLRILTAISLLAVLLPAVFYPQPFVFALVAGILIACANWEWFRLNGASQSRTFIAGLCSALACGVFWLFQPSPAILLSIWLACVVLWVFGGGVLLRSGVPAWGKIHKTLRQLIGFVFLCAAWLAVVFARTRGINFLFSILALVWVADIAAYFVGRSLGGEFFKYKLAPDISPGKTREGALGGLGGVMLMAMSWVFADHVLVLDSPSIYSTLMDVHWAFMFLAVLFLGVMSICGDLLESLVKRSAGAKDSSQLLPGHGGVLDRVDALLPVLPLAMLLQSFSMGSL